MAAAQIVDKFKNTEQGAAIGDHEQQKTAPAVGSVELDKTPDAKVIKLSGPLSMIYSQALLQVYGQEDAGSEAVGAVVNETVEEPDSFQITTEPNHEGVGEVFVYAMSEDDLENQQGFAVACESIFNAKEKYQNIVVAIESYNYKNLKRVQIVMDTAKSVGGKVFTKRNNALNYIKNI